MSRIGRMDHLWMIGGAVGAAILLAVGWFLLIGPQKSQASGLLDRTQVALQRQTELQHKLVELRQENAKLPQYRVELDRDRRALPVTPALSEFLRELQAAGDNAQVTVNALVAGDPIQVTGTSGQLYSLSITVTALGTATTLGRFLDELQQVQPRAVLINSLGAAAADPAGSLSGAVTLTLGMQAFVAPQGSTAKAPAATPTPTATAK